MIGNFSLHSLQDRLVQSTPVEEHFETEILAEVEQTDVQSAPSEIGTLDLQVSPYLTRSRSFILKPSFRVTAVIIDCMESLYC